MDYGKKKVYEDLSDSLPDLFPDNQAEVIARRQRALLLQIDELLNPEDETLNARRSELIYEIQQTLKPPKLSGRNSDLLRIRSGYIDSKIALQLEHLPVTDSTPALAFWQYVTALKRKYKSNNTPANAE